MQHFMQRRVTLLHETTPQTTKEMLHDVAPKFGENQTLSCGQTDATRCCMKCCIRLTGA